MKVPLLRLFLVFFAFLSSCKKSVDTAATLIGKWRLDSIQVWMFDPVQGPKVVTIYKSSSDYYDFRNDSYLYRFFNGNHDTVPYSLGKNNGEWLITYGSGSADTIQSLSDRFLILMNPQGGRSRMMFSK